MFTPLTVTEIQPMPRGVGTSIRLTVPDAAPPIEYAAGGGIFQIRELVVWLRDPEHRTDSQTPMVTLHGVITDRQGRPVWTVLETWTEELSLADAIESSEYLQQQSLTFTVEGSQGEVVPG